MKTKDFIVFGLWVVAIVLFALYGFTIEDGAPDFNFIGLGLASTVTGFLVDKFWNPAA